MQCEKLEPLSHEKVLRTSSNYMLLYKLLEV